jgi:hypothetical protein
VWGTRTEQPLLAEVGKPFAFIGQLDGWGSVLMDTHRRRRTRRRLWAGSA